MITKWKVLNKYDFELIPGQPVDMEDGDKSYYQYLNERPNETGKNVQAIQWMLNKFEKGLEIYEPFGGCGVFSVALQEELKPYKHVITELDKGCVEQLKHCLSKYSVEIIHGDAHELLGYTKADLYVCDFPFFTLNKINNGIWYEEMKRMCAQKPKGITITDGTACRYHWTYKHAKKFDLNIDSTKESYAYAMSKYLYNQFGYSITACGHHGTCFYFLAEPVKPNEIKFKYYPAGSGPDGLKRIK